MSRERELIESAARLCEERADQAEKNADALKEFGGEYSGNEARSRKLAALFVREVAERIRSLSQPEAGPKLDAPAKVGGGSFSVGVAWETVIKAAQRSYEYELSKKKLTPEEKITEEMNRRELFDMLHNRDQSKTVYGVLATAYRPSQHEASMADEENSDRQKCTVCGRPVLCGSRHPQCGTYALESERQRDELRAENEELRGKLNKGVQA